MHTKLEKLTRPDLDELATMLSIPTISSISGRPKNIGVLITEINEAIKKISDEERKYDIFKKIFLKGKFDGFIFSIKSNITTLPDCNITDKFKSETIADAICYIPKTVEFFFENMVVIKVDTVVICVRKHLQVPLSVEHCRRMIKEVFGHEVDYFYNLTFQRVIFTDIQTNRLVSKYLETDKDKKCLLLYNAHAASGKYLTVSSKLIASNEKILKDYKDIDDGSIDETTILALILSKSKDKARMEALIEYGVIGAPKEVMEALVEVRFDLIQLKGVGKPPIRYKINLKKNELKILNIDTELCDIIDIYKKLKGIKNELDGRKKGV